MLSEERKTYLLECLKKEGRLNARQIAAELGLSDDTIRRDLRELAAVGKLRRVHGGALPKASAESGLTERSNIASSSKREVGSVAAALIEVDQVVMLDGGTTALQIVHHLAKDLRCTVVTHSPTVAVALADHELVKVVMIGGVLYKHSMVNVGAASIESMSKVFADTFFMGVTGVEAQSGLTTGDYEEAHIKKSLSDRAADTIVLASEEKLGVSSPYRVMALENASGIVVDSQTPKAFLKTIQAHGLEIYQAVSANGR